METVQWPLSVFRKIIYVQSTGIGISCYLGDTCKYGKTRRRVRYASVSAKAYFHYLFTFIISLFSFVFDRRREGDKRSRRWGFSETHSQLNKWEACLWRKRSEMQKNGQKHLLSLPKSHIFMITQMQSSTHPSPQQCWLSLKTICTRRLSYAEACLWN